MAWLMSNKLIPLLRLCLLQLRLLGFSCNLSEPILNIIDNLKLYSYKILTNIKSPLEICRACHIYETTIQERQSTKLCIKTEYNTDF